MNTQIQIQFSCPGQWDQFTLTSVYRDADGYIHTARYAPADIPAEQAPALASVVSALVSMGEPWQAVQVWAHLTTTTSYGEDDPYTPIGQRDEVVLTVEAVNERGGRRIFAFTDYPEFFITDPAAVEFFKYFTTNQ